MSLTDMVIMPGDHYQDACNAIREKTGGTNIIRSGEMAELIRSISGGSGISFTLPIGRSRGDINGDGHITNADRQMLNRHLVLDPEITDTVALWCADLDNSGTVDIGDMIAFERYFGGTAPIPAAADYYGNWTYESGDGVDGYYYIDVSVEEVTANSVVTLLVSSRADTIKSVTPLNGKIRVTASVCPGAELSCGLLIHEDGGGMDSAPVPETMVSNLFSVRVTNNGTAPVFYFSRNHKQGTSIPSETELVDELNSWEMYALLYDSNTTRGLDYGVGDLYPLWLEGPFSSVSVGVDDYTGVFDNMELFTVDPRETEIYLEVRKPI